MRYRVMVTFVTMNYRAVSSGVTVRYYTSTRYSLLIRYHVRGRYVALPDGYHVTIHY
jgi:hypothetical protein